MGSPFDIWRLQSGCFGLFRYLLCAVSRFVLETAEIRHTVSYVYFTPSRTGTRACDTDYPMVMMSACIYSLTQGWTHSLATLPFQNGELGICMCLRLELCMADAS